MKWRAAVLMWMVSVMAHAQAQVPPGRAGQGNGDLWEVLTNADTPKASTQTLCVPRGDNRFPFPLVLPQPCRVINLTDTPERWVTRQVCGENAMTLEGDMRLNGEVWRGSIKINSGREKEELAMVSRKVGACPLPSDARPAARVQPRLPALPPGAGPGVPVPQNR
jgi:hypothetical protein